jgi:hypothetical protein
VQFKSKPTGAKAIGLGVFTGIATLVNPTVLSVAIGYLPIVYRKIKASAGYRTSLFAITLCCGLMTVSPWLIRNWTTFGRWVPIRSYMGANLYLGNSGSGRAFIPASEFDLIQPQELNLLCKLGEIDYDNDCAKRAIAWIQGHPDRFFEVCRLRLLTFWGKEVFFGGFPAISFACVGVPFLVGFLGLLAALRERRELWPILVPLLMYPLVYYVTHAQARYRFPIDMFILILLAYAIHRVIAIVRKETVSSDH